VDTTFAPGGTVDLDGTLLKAGDLFTGSTDSGAGWALHSLVVDTIPEPASIGMICLAGTGILFVRRRLML
jgi:hypothetical protein